MTEIIQEEEIPIEEQDISIDDADIDESVEEEITTAEWDKDEYEEATGTETY